MMFDDLKAEPKVLNVLGSVPPEVERCLTRAFNEISRGQLPLTPAGRQNLYLAFACDYVFVVSVTPGLRLAVVLELYYEAHEESV